MLKEQHLVVGPACRGDRHLHFEKEPVCNRGMMKLLGLGKSRFSWLSKAVRQGKPCPYDSRYVARGPQPQSEARTKVFEFLSQLYHQAAETIPDGLNSNKRPRQGAKKTDNAKIDRSLIRHLPHASISDYHRQCAALNPEVPISRKLFCSAP